jgi:type I restriction enzyme S subunit
MKALLPEEGMVSEYLAYLVQGLNDRFLDEWVKQGATVESIEHESMANTPIPVPPLNRQRAIASYLDAETKRIDGLIAAKRELKSTLDGFARSTFLAEVATLALLLPGEPDGRLPWLPKIPSSWTRCKVKHVVLHFDQGVSPQCESRTPDEGEWGVLKAGCINSGSFDPMESKALPPEIPSLPEITVCKGDLIISRANTQNLVGRSAVATQDYPKLMLSDKLYRLKVDATRCLPEFVRRTMWVPAVRSRIEERATGASPSMLNIDRRTILELDLVLPPVEDQQALLEKVDERAHAIGELIEHVERELAMLIELRSSTITDAVLGRIDVRQHMAI